MHLHNYIIFKKGLYQNHDEILSAGPRRGFGIDNLNKRITDLKMSGPTGGHTRGSISGGMSNGSDLNPRLPHSNVVSDLL